MAVATLASLLCFQPAAGAERERNVDGIRDNSFFVEEAYNQDPGVVQHILTAFYNRENVRGPDDESLDFSFTQEWPLFSQTHQFSYTLPYSFAESGGKSQNGFGDLLLNYRWQVFFDEQTLAAFAPRLSLILPTGDFDRDFGEDTVGGQMNLPFSTAIGSRWYAHLNAGTTFLPGAASAKGRDLRHFNLGASAIYAATSDVHFLCEWIGNWEEGLNSNGRRNREFTSLLSPGARKAFNFSNDSQLVLGVAAPIGLTGSAPDYGIFFYFSFEHFFKRELN